LHSPAPNAPVADPLGGAHFSPRPLFPPPTFQDGESLRAERDEAAAEVVALRRRVAELEASVKAAEGERDVAEKRVAGAWTRGVAVFCVSLLFFSRRGLIAELQAQGDEDREEIAAVKKQVADTKNRCVPHPSWTVPSSSLT